MNDPIVRKNSINSEIVTWEIHKDWFTKKLDDDCSFLYVIEYKDKPIGQVRFDIREPDADISFTLDERYRGRGFGTRVLQEAIGEFITSCKNITILNAKVKNDNVASIKIFLKLGFEFKKVKKYINEYKFSL